MKHFLLHKLFLKEPKLKISVILLSIICGAQRKNAIDEFRTKLRPPKMKFNVENSFDMA